MPWDFSYENTPLDSDVVGNGNEELQQIKQNVRARLAKEHQFDIAEGGAQPKQGTHRAGSARIYVQAAAPTTKPDGTTVLDADDNGRLWVDLDDGKFYYYAHPSWVEMSTAAQVLAKLLTVDGAGSGLDADLLDGQHGSYYQNAGNLNAGTLPTARLPALTGDVTSSAGSNSVALVAAQVLAKLLTVDGAGSGLDADLHDGYQAGNASGNMPVSNGTVNINLNSDLLDGKHLDVDQGLTADEIPLRDANGVVRNPATTVNSGLVGFWPMDDVSEYPTGTATYFQDAWATVDGWAAVGGSVAVSGGTLVVTSAGGANDRGVRSISIVAGATVKLKLKRSGGSAGFLRIGTNVADVYTEAVGLQYDYKIINITVASAATELRIYANSGGADVGAVTVDWIYIGDGSYAANSLLDNSGSGNHGQIFGATPATGVSGNGLIADGIDDRCDIGIAIPNSFTMAAWVQRTKSGATQLAFALGGTVALPICAFRFDASNNFTIRYIDSAGAAALRTIGIDNGTMRHLCATYDGQALRTYVNGVLVDALASAISTIRGTTARIFNDSTAGLAAPFGGTIDEPRIYNRALSAAEVWELYARPGAHDIDGVMRSTEPLPLSIPVRDSSGDLKVNGIRFPGTQVADADPNTLDDYEEGTFTPTIVGSTSAGAGTYSLQEGGYTKIGRKVFFRARLTWSAHTGTGNMKLGGLPFAVGAAGFQALVQASNLTFTGQLLLELDSGASTGSFKTFASATVAADLVIDTAATVIVTGSYNV